MSKFFNYVKKFLSLSFMSAIAAFSLSFNQVSAASTGTRSAFGPVLSERQDKGREYSVGRYQRQQPLIEDIIDPARESLKKELIDIIDRARESLEKQSVTSEQGNATQLNIVSLIGSLSAPNTLNSEGVGGSQEEGQSTTNVLSPLGSLLGSNMQNTEGVGASRADGQSKPDVLSLLGSLLGTNMQNTEEVGASQADGQSKTDVLSLLESLLCTNMQSSEGMMGGKEEEMPMNSVGGVYKPVLGGSSNFALAGSRNDNYEESYNDLQTGNVYFIKNSENESNGVSREATWVGNTSTGEIRVPAEINLSENVEDTVPVTGTVLGIDKNAIINSFNSTRLALDAKNYADGLANITVKKMENVPNLTKIVISNLNNNLSVPILADADLTKLLARNSKNGLAAWYRDFSGDSPLLVGESNMVCGNTTGGYAHSCGADYRFVPETNSWRLTTFPNQSTCVIAASFVDENGMLQKVDGLDLPNGIQTDKIQKIIITNVQDDEQKEAIIKCAKLALSGLENSLNDETDWVLSPGQPDGEGTLTFKKVIRDMKSIILDTISDYQKWLKDHEDESLTSAAKLDEFKKIIDRNFENASEDQIKIKNILKNMLDSLQENGTLEIVNNMQQAVKNMLNSIAQGLDIDGITNGAGTLDSVNSLNSINEKLSAIMSGTDNSSVTRPDPQNDLESSDESKEDPSSVSGSTKNNNNSSKTVLGDASSQNTTSDSDSDSASERASKLAETVSEWQTWYVGAGKEKTPKEQYKELKNRINAVMDSLSDEEKVQAKKLIEEIDDALAAMDTAPSSSAGSSTGTSSTSAYSTTPSSSSSSSAQTKTSDSGVSPELLSLILSGSLAGLGISLKKRGE